ncbi:hypothetical protein D3874_23685 [Oleomonas cavernae]|uniref:Tat pathway signal protein n=1 Tax=Oleomonas cavernae TaxID=2320859 RepID=A0A418WI27_9PROT|nr:hypothetical protein [Oleomonas cavernae]RJF89602.1 hypothetical protein D3874_23685 [Oleomonas cavernae]
MTMIASRRHFLGLLAFAAMGLPAAAARAEAARDGLDIVGDIVVLAPIYMSVVRRGKVRAIMTIASNLDVTDLDIRERIARELPRLRDAYLRALDPYLDRIDLKTAPNVMHMTGLLQKATDGLFGTGKTTVLITHATIRRMT